MYRYTNPMWVFVCRELYRKAPNIFARRYYKCRNVPTNYALRFTAIEIL